MPRRNRTPADQIQAVKKLPKNTKGRDFVVGDLHGCRSYLEEALVRVNFDPAADRVLSVGDLVDRGPDPFGTLALLKEPWFHAVIANHEAMMLTYLGEYFSHYHQPRDFIGNGGYWIESYEQGSAREELNELVKLVMALPLVLAVDADIPFNVTHGDLLDMAETQAELEGLGSIDRGTADNRVWSRSLIYNPGKVFHETEVDGLRTALTARPIDEQLNLTYAGHTIVKQLVVHQSHVFIDRGVYQRVVKGNEQFDLCLIEHARFAPQLMMAARQLTSGH